jgi:hypothetical protein
LSYFPVTILEIILKTPRAIQDPQCRKGRAAVSGVGTFQARTPHTPLGRMKGFHVSGLPCTVEQVVHHSRTNVEEGAGDIVAFVCLTPCTVITNPGSPPSPQLLSKQKGETTSPAVGAGAAHTITQQ